MDLSAALESVRELLLAALERIASATLAYAPRLLAGAALILLGWLLARVISAFVGLLLRRLALDRLSAQVRLSQALRRAGIQRTPSLLAQRFVFWAIWLIFGVASLDVLELSDLPMILQRVLGYVPDLLATGLIIAVGIAFGRFARNLLSSAQKMGALKQGERLGSITQRLIIGLFLIVAAQQLGFKTDLVVAIVATGFGTLALAFSVAFALGASPVIRHILAGHFLRRSLAPGGAITIRGKRGSVERVGPIDTLLRSNDEVWSIPNGVLIDEVVIR